MFKFPKEMFPDVMIEGQEMVKSSFDFRVATQSNILELCHPENCQILT